MGTFFYPLTLIGETGDSETVEALVDAGSNFSTISRAILDRLGVRPFARGRLRLANGQVEEADLGAVDARIDDFAPRPIICAFGRPGALPILGAHALDAFLLAVDLDQHRLLPVEGWWA